MPNRELDNWNSLIIESLHNRNPRNCFGMFKKMMEENIWQNLVSLINLLRASTKVKSLTLGVLVHGIIVISGLIPNLVVRTALLTMYSKLGSLKNASLMFKVEKLINRKWEGERSPFTPFYGFDDAVDILQKSIRQARRRRAIDEIKFYDKEAVEISAKLLEKLHCLELQNYNPEFYTAWNYRKLDVEYFLSQPGSNPVSILNEELRVNQCVNSEKTLSLNFDVSGVLFDRSDKELFCLVKCSLQMYAKFGEADPSRLLFDHLYPKGLIARTAMISSYAQIGYTSEALDIFICN
ncbi:pentatricopeptide repeat-containing protein At1g18485-like [Spinacia oleracea]|uniref:Pentatricopeptide repeat-containing protein At1g18485-like n=1 Tax=Spinacia oleracea TaxID=3562 RepID=A0ABM3RT14_SPIOL|nr:pentatricopeptide repeat-containing protein At1g18485-like [Spinacia oleracea]